MVHTLCMTSSANRGMSGAMARQGCVCKPISLSLHLNI
jgi:hypothetical protein